MKKIRHGFPSAITLDIFNRFSWNKLFLEEWHQVFKLCNWCWSNHSDFWVMVKYTRELHFSLFWKIFRYCFLLAITWDIFNRFSWSKLFLEDWHLDYKFFTWCWSSHSNLRVIVRITRVYKLSQYLKNFRHRFPSAITWDIFKRFSWSKFFFGRVTTSSPLNTRDIVQIVQGFTLVYFTHF